MTIGERERDDEGDRHQDGDTATTAVLFGATPRKTTTTCGERPHSDEEPREEFDAADQDSGLGHEANIFVDDVADLVRGYALQLIAGQRSQQGGCESDGTFLGRATDGEGIGCAVVDDIDPRHTVHASGDRHLFDDVPEPRMVLFLYLAGSNGSQDRTITVDRGIDP